MRIALKGVIRLFLGWVEGKLRDDHIPLPPPELDQAEKKYGMDVIEYGTNYILGIILFLATRTKWTAFGELEADGKTLRITGLDAIPPEMAPSGGEGQPDAGAQPVEVTSTLADTGDSVGPTGAEV